MVGRPKWLDTGPVVGLDIYRVRHEHAVALLSGTDAELDDATMYCRGKLDEIQRTYAEKEA